MRFPDLTTSKQSLAKSSWFNYIVDEVPATKDEHFEVHANI